VAQIVLILLTLFHILHNHCVPFTKLLNLTKLLYISHMFLLGLSVKHFNLLGSPVSPAIPSSLFSYKCKRDSKYSADFDLTYKFTFTYSHLADAFIQMNE